MAVSEAQEKIHLRSNSRAESDRTLFPPETWQDNQQHFASALSHPWYSMIMRLNGLISYSTYDYFRSKGFLPALMPITSEAVTSPMGLGSDSLPVEVDLFGNSTYLADSMQFHLEYMLRQHPHGVFYIMPTFRGEDPDSRHLNQFFHIEAEFCGELDDLIYTIEGLLIQYTQSIKISLGQELEQTGIGTDHLDRFLTLAKGGLPRIRFQDACKLLGDDQNWYKFLDGSPISLTSEAEQELLKRFGEAVWLTHLPKFGVPFYQADDSDGISSLCADLLIGIGETVGSGQRHHSYDNTLKALKERHIDPAAYEWYLRMKKEYPLQTCGFGIGLERFLLWVMKHDDIRDTHLMTRLKGQKCIP
ncbi:MAG TPA: asparagine synthetase A [Alphaproteobacteria bacterium]|nr:asparaginase [Micavibrio sp.]HRK96844.1 asparagine synthetase A [Alphaproteobacteria bacterium]